MKIKICDNPLDLEKASSILFVGKCGTGKTRTIKEILRQAICLICSYNKINI